MRNVVDLALNILIAFMLVGCRDMSAKRSDGASADSSTVVGSRTIHGDSIKPNIAKGTSAGNVNGFRAMLDSLPVALNSCAIALERFKSDFVSSDLEKNEDMLLLFEDFRERVMQAIENEWSANGNFPEDRLLADHKREELTDELSATGVQLAFNDMGEVFLQPDQEVVKHYFYDALSEPSRKFYLMNWIESVEDFTGDASFSISLNEIADRIGYWDSFIASYPNYRTIRQVRSTRDMYLYYLLAGIDNNPAFDGDDKINDEYLRTFNYFIGKYPSSESVSVVSDYVKKLSANNGQNDPLLKKIIDDLWQKHTANQ